MCLSVYLQIKELIVKKYRFIVETCLLSHGLKSIGDYDMYEALKNTDAGYAWIDSGRLRITGLDDFMEFRTKREPARAGVNNIDMMLTERKSAMLSASGAMFICEKHDIPLAVSGE